MSENFELSTPITTIWLSPRATIREAAAKTPGWFIALLFATAGIANTLERASTRNLGDTLSLGLILAFVCTLGPVATMLAYWVWSFLIVVTGQWLKGAGRQKEIMAAIAWAKIPVLFTLPLWGVVVFAGGIEIFQEEIPNLEENVPLLCIVAALLLAILVLNLWSFVTLCNTVAEIQNFRSAWKGLLNLLLAALTGILPLVVLLLLLMLVFRTMI